MARSFVLGLSLAVLFNLSLFPFAAFGHTTRGHNVIEAAAYKNLLKKKKGEIPGYPEYSGKDILDFLIARGILRVPPCYPHPGRSSECAEYAGMDSLQWLPVVGSGDMDAIMYRQFSKNGQYFHFMASPGAIYRNPELDPRTGAPRGLTEEAYPIAIRFITGMYYEILEQEELSKKMYRDIYSLIHTIGDSFSRAHVERDTATWAIKYLKPWQATAWTPYLVYWSALPYLFSDEIHWFPEDVRDKQYLRSDLVSKTEVEFFDKNPYLVDRSILNPQGIAAANAVEDLLLMTFRILYEGGDGRIRKEAVAEVEWRKYLNRHFQAYTDTTMIDTLGFHPAPREEQEWRPMVQVGLRAKAGTVPQSRDLTLVMNFARPPSVIDPFGFAAGYEIGKRRVDEKELWVGSVTFGLYLWQYSDLLAWGIEPVIADLTWDGSTLTVDPLISFLRLDTWIDRRVWISANAFRYSLLHGWRLNEFSLTLGVAFSRDIPFHWTDWFSSQRYPKTTGSLTNDQWNIPDVDSPLRKNPRVYSLFHPFGYVFRAEPQHTQVSLIGFTFLRDIDPDSRFSRWSYGLTANTGGEFRAEKIWLYLQGGPVLRFRISSPLGVTVEPLSPKYSGGVTKGAHGYVDAEGSAGLLLMLGSVDINLEMLRYSYKYQRFDQKLVAGVRVGILRE